MTRAAGRRYVPRHLRLPGVDPRAARLTAESAVIGLVVGVAVIAPWTGRGYLLLLDWVAGPHQAITPGLYGLDPAALDALPYRLVTQAVRHVAGAGVTSWLMILLYFPIAASGISALAGGDRWRRHSAALFVVCNPFVAERVRAGHVAFLLSVALLAWLLASAVRARRRGRFFAARPAGWYALAMIVGPHAAWLGGAGLIAVALLPRPRRTDVARTLLIVVSAGCVYAYAVVVMVSSILKVKVSQQDLDVYAPHAGPGGLFVTLASLRGFWRGDPAVVVDRLPLTAVVLLVALAAAVLAGLVRLARREPYLGAPLCALAAAGLVLGAGIHGPLASVYRLAFNDLPLFAVMREQQKWIALPMLCYAVAVGAAAEALAALARRTRPMFRLAPAGAVLACWAMPVAVAPGLVWGLGGDVHLSRYPQGWHAADRVMGAGTESALFLPWHEYQSFGFTAGRTVATPAGAFFRRPVLSSDAVELGPVRTNSSSRRMAYLQRLVAAGGGGHFGRLVAPLGVGYVVLALDREATAYAWLDAQPDLRLILRTAQIEVYQVEQQGTGRVVAARAATYADALALAARGELGTEALLPGGPAQGSPPSAAYGGIHRLSPTSWRIDRGAPGWVVLPEEWSRGWIPAGGLARATVAGTVAVETDGNALTVRYRPWRYLRLGLAASLISLLVLVVAGLFEHRRDFAAWWASIR